MTGDSRTPFKLANLEGGDLGRPAIVVDDRVHDLHRVAGSVETSSATAQIVLPSDNRGLIEQYEQCRGRLSEIAAAISTDDSAGQDPAEISFRPPILYPWNLVAVAVNYRAHGEEMDRQLDEDYLKDPPSLHEVPQGLPESDGRGAGDSGGSGEDRLGTGVGLNHREKGNQDPPRTRREIHLGVRPHPGHVRPGDVVQEERVLQRGLVQREDARRLCTDGALHRPG